jgi:predicted transcriptional regulator
METLTKTEERVMQILWTIKKGVVKDIIEKLPDPKPPYNTISSVVRILEKKGFVDYKAYGKTHEYFAKITKARYRKFSFKKFLSNYFEGSYESVVSFMLKEKQFSPEEIDELKKIIEKGEK